MPSSYPGAADSFGAPAGTDSQSTPVGGRTHSQSHTDLGDAVEAIEAELGVNPSGASATVVARLDALDAAWPAADAAHVAAGDPHPQYETSAEAAAKVSAHTGASDPHGDRAYAAALVDDLSGVTNAATARTNLGLGGSATLNVGTTTGTVAAGDDARIVGAVPGSPMGTSLWTVASRDGGVRAMTQSRLCAMPLMVGRTFTADMLALYVETPAAATTIRLGIYADGPDGMPGALLLDAGTVDSSSAGQKSIVISQAVPAGRVWLAAVAQGGAPSIRGTDPSVVVPGLPCLNTISIAAAGFPYVSGVTGALPATFGAPTLSNTAGFFVAIRGV